MKQISLATTGFELVTKRTRKRVLLAEMNMVVPWTTLMGLIQPFAPSGAGTKGGRPAFPVQTMLRIHVLQQLYGLSDPAMEEALHDTPLYCEFARLDPGATRLPDESTILRFRHSLEANNLSLQLFATINAALASKVEHSFRVIKRQFGFTKVRYKGLAKNTAQLITLFALSNLWMARKRIIQGTVG
jgi:IS5 family transposase